MLSKLEAISLYVCLCQFLQLLIIPAHLTRLCLSLMSNMCQIFPVLIRFDMEDLTECREAVRLQVS